MNPYADIDNRDVLDPPRTTMNYVESITGLFRNRFWFLTMLAPAIVYLPQAAMGPVTSFGINPMLFLRTAISVLGYLVLQGYVFQITSSLIATNGKTYSTFDLRHLKTYAIRGAGLLAWSVLFGLVDAAIVFRRDSHGGMGPYFYAMLFFTWVSGSHGNSTLSFALGSLLRPMMFRAGCSQDFRLAFDSRWETDFVKKMWIEMIVSALVVLLVAIVTAVPIVALAIYLSRSGVPMATVAVGIASLPSSLICHFVRGHLDFQMYQVYLSRGGVPMQNQPGDIPSVPDRPVVDEVTAGYTPDPSNPYAAPASRGYNPTKAIGDKKP